VSRIRVLNFSPNTRRINSASVRIRTFLILAVIGLSVFGGPTTASQAAQTDSITITDLKVSNLDDSVGILSSRHLVTLQGTFTNTSDQEISRLELNLVSTSAIKSRSQLAELISDPTISRNLSSSDFSAVIRNLAPGAQRNWRITFVGENVLGANAAGVYALGVKPRTSASSEATVVTTPWFFNTETKKTNVSFVVPLTTLNSHLANGDVVNINSDLDQAQRLLDLMSNQSGSKISWLQDSALRPWVNQLAANSDSNIPDKLNLALDDLNVSAYLPYGQVDFTALNNAKQQSYLQDAIDLSKSPELAKPVIYAPSKGVADRKTIALLNDQGIRTIVSNDFLRGNDRITTSAVASMDSNPVLVYDLAASSCLSRSIESSLESFKVATCLKSEIGMITAESPQRPREIIVLAPADWKISSDKLTVMISDLSNQSWMQFKNFELVAAAESEQNFVSDFVDYENPLTTLQIRAANALQIETENLSAVFVDQELASSFNASRILGFSQLWRSSVEATDFLTQNLALVDTYLGAISIQTSSRITTPQETSEIPITIVNESDREISVSVDLTSPATSRFSAKPSELIRVASGQRVTVPVVITLIGAGVVDVQVQLIAPNGRGFGEVEKIQISSAAYSQFARTLVWGAFGLLVLLALSNFIKRQKDRRTRNTSTI
jgi:hypothetical protein